MSEKVDGVLARLEAGGRVAFVSDAGMPGVSDPGQRLVDAALDAGARVEVVPGPSAVTCALVASGLASEHFFFEGFLPRRRSAQPAYACGKLAAIPGTLVVYESPRRVAETLANVAEVFPGRRVALVRELTKLHEEVVRATAPELAAEVAARGRCAASAWWWIAAPDGARLSSELRRVRAWRHRRRHTRLVAGARWRMEIAAARPRPGRPGASPRARQVLGSAEYSERLRRHYETFVSEFDFNRKAAIGFNAVRLPVPWHVFGSQGDSLAHIPAIDYVDRAMEWAAKYDMRVLLDLATVPGGQGDSNEGATTPETAADWHSTSNGRHVALNVLDNLAERYGSHDALLGIELLDSPVMSVRRGLFNMISPPRCCRARA